MHGKDGKRKKGKGVCSTGAAALQKPHHMGHVEYSPFSLHFEKPYIKRSLYSLYLREGAPPQRGQSGRRQTMISLHMHAWSIFRRLSDTYDIIMSERFDFHKARRRKRKGCVALEANFYGANHIGCYVY